MNFRRARSEPAFCLTVFKIKCHRRMLYTLRNCVSLTCFVTTVGTRGETSLVAKAVNHGDVFEEMEVGMAFQGCESWRN